MQSFLALVAIVVGMCFAYGWACWFLPANRRDWLTLTLVTFGLSLGWLTLWMFWVTLIWPGHLSVGLVLGGSCIVGIAGLWVKRQDLKPAPVPGSISQAIQDMDAVEKTLTAVIVLICAGILFNSVYWPFSDQDALVIYAPIAKEIFRTRTLPIGQHLYEGYPALVQMAYVYTHLAYGSINEYLARLVPALMALGAVGVTAALGREMRSSRTGIVAAGLVVLTPFFSRWASSGYVDVPSSFYFGLSALFAWRWSQDGGSRNAALAGICAGLALWTKNSAFTLLISLGALIVHRWWVGQRHTTAAGMVPLKLGQIVWLVGGIVATAGPWYIRNLVTFHFIIPPTLWDYAAQHTLPALFKLVWSWRDVGAIGVIYTLSILYGLARLVWHLKEQPPSGWMILLIMVLPFYAAWWWLASYDIRFLVTIVPLLGVLAGLTIDEWSTLLQKRLSPAWNALAQWAAIACVLALIPFAVSKAVLYKGSILHKPFMGNAEKHRIVLGGLYDVALAVDDLPPGSRIVGVPSAARYHIDLTRFPTVSEQVVEVPPSELAGDYDYAVYRFMEDSPPGWMDDATPPLLRTADGYSLYAVPASDELKP